MLSYRHAFHAGNHADVLKHAVLSRIVLSLSQKEKPFSYIDTHSGAGLYELDSEWSKKTEESGDGILLLLDRTDIPELLFPYIEMCRDLFKSGHTYPGSPEIVRVLSRETDHLTLMELHPTEIDILRSNFSGNERIHIHHRDGYSGLLALSPPEPRRGFALIDPSYETDDDFINTVKTMITVNKRWPVGSQMLWYPLLSRRTEEIRIMKERLIHSGIPGILCAELYLEEITPETPEFGLIGSGLLIISPPWKLDSELAIILPYLAEILGKKGKGHFTLEWLTAAP